MLSKKRRIEKKNFTALQKKGKSLFTKLFSVTVGALKDKEAFKVSVVVSKKVAKTAVTRNRLRRVVYGALGEMLPHLQKGLFFIFYLKSGVEKITKSQLEKEIQDLFKNNGLIIGSKV
jgi:ribonuclease P protein component